MREVGNGTAPRGRLDASVALCVVLWRGRGDVEFERFREPLVVAESGTEVEEGLVSSGE